MIMIFLNQVLAVARAGAGTNNIPVKECTEKRKSWCLIHRGQNANDGKRIGDRELIIICPANGSRDQLGTDTRRSQC